MKAVWLIARSVLLEAVRRREIYAVVMGSVALIALVLSLDFFQLEGLSKFYREVSLKIMGLAVALTVVVLAARQLPRELEKRTIYPLLARPVTRPMILFGKLLGVLLASLFCFALFMGVYVVGALLTGGAVPWALFLQYVYLQVLVMLILATLCFWLSLMLNLDAAITLGVLFFITASTFSSMTTYLYDFAEPAVQVAIRVLIFLVPQLVVFDLSDRAIHAEAWEPLSVGTLGALSLYALVFAGIYFGLALLLFRRRTV